MRRALVTMGTAEAAKRAIAAKVMAGTTQLTVNRFNKNQAGASTGAMGAMAGGQQGGAGSRGGLLQSGTTPGKGNRAAELRMKHSRGNSTAKGCGSWGPPPPRQVVYSKSPQQRRRMTPAKREAAAASQELGPGSPMPLAVSTPFMQPMRTL